MCRPYFEDSFQRKRLIKMALYESDYLGKIKNFKIGLPYKKDKVN